MNTKLLALIYKGWRVTFSGSDLDGYVFTAQHPDAKWQNNVHYSSYGKVISASTIEYGIDTLVSYCEAFEKEYGVPHETPQ